MKSKFEHFLGKELSIKIDRPIGSNHPKYDWKYPINYGFVPEVINSDGEELDAYLLGVGIPVTEFTGKCIAIIHRLNDDDDKLVVVPSDMKDISDDEIKELINFQEKYFDSVIVR